MVGMSLFTIKWKAIFCN